MYAQSLNVITLTSFFLGVHTFFFMLPSCAAGVPGIGPNFWKWFLVPGLFYGAEVALRFFRARKNLYLAIVHYMEPDVINLSFLQPFGKDGHKEGQVL